MQPIALHSKIVGVPAQVGASKGGMYAFMIGTQRVTSSGRAFERPVVFVGTKPDRIPNADQWIAIPQLIRFSQPGSWTFDEAAIVQVMNGRLTDVLSPSDGTGD
ncbi:hypothetical protein [Altericista sp. CCNU0014]|uniref:hypothetical protein n=1 Tax=Altericista sp. CCNU0014 TaxID=3082949 RepID=UPI0038504023